MSAISFTNLTDVVYGIVSIVCLAIIPAAFYFHRKVIRPLRWVLGMSATDSPTGEEIMSVPKQLAILRKNQVDVMAILGPNGGNSILDMVRKTHKLAISTDRQLKEHLEESARNERDIWKAIATGQIPDDVDVT